MFKNVRNIFFILCISFTVQSLTIDWHWLQNNYVGKQCGLACQRVRDMAKQYPVLASAGAVAGTLLLLAGVLKLRHLYYADAKDFNAVGGITGYVNGKENFDSSERILPTESAASVETFETLVTKSDNLFKNNMITEDNKIKHIAGSDQVKQQIILSHAKNVRPIMHRRVQVLMNAFLQYKLEHGSTPEKELYKTMTTNQFIDRLLTNRPLTFYQHQDLYLLRDGTEGEGGFECIGTDHQKSPLLLKDYLSYDEMPIAALLGVSVPTYFINNGNRSNKGKKAQKDSFQETGIYVGLVGARFEKPGLMEYSHMLINEKQNTAENGYSGESVDKKKSGLLRLWADFYDEPYFKTYNQVKQEVSQVNNDRYKAVKVDNDPCYLDTEIYKKRLKMILEPFFHDANQQGKRHNQKVYCHMVGLGMGYWAVNRAVQEEIFFKACEEILKQNTFSYIKDVDFSYFDQLEKTHSDGYLKKINDINLWISQRNPADKLVGAHADKLLVAMYPWDSNAYPGNEYWTNRLSASGDPAAACCSTITELQNPLINSNLSHKTLRLYPH